MRPIKLTLAALATTALIVPLAACGSDADNSAESSNPSSSSAESSQPESQEGSGEKTENKKQDGECAPIDGPSAKVTVGETGYSVAMPMPEGWERNEEAESDSILLSLSSGQINASVVGGTVEVGPDEAFQQYVDTLNMLSQDGDLKVEDAPEVCGYPAKNMTYNTTMLDTKVVQEAKMIVVPLEQGSISLVVTVIDESGEPVPAELRDELLENIHITAPA
ncbi:hypothetical protein CCICO_03430 [Corynebacterium ciconiae DSM 44920]|uniref:hypothetical protein n=1 Tax=Corynebacterium ciconiae TaxID=227319 RepID=UPI0003709C43|nr:hypothetical protein [Corynebacterium ciconiae]WKD60725.1 hypothetical protein CCICO_03430 [Corynebacterium ciconiae DSM 44920]